MGRRITDGDLYVMLRKALAWHGITQKELAAAWNAAHPEKTRQKYQAWFSDLLNGKRRWRDEEMYFVLDYMNIPHSQMHIYFPPHGVEEKEYALGGAYA